MNDAIEHKLWGGAALTEIGTLAAYSHDVLDVNTAAVIMLGIGTSIVGIYAIDSAHELLKNVANNANEIYRNLIKG